MANYNTEDLKNAFANYNASKASTSQGALSYDPKALASAAKNYGGLSKGTSSSLSGYNAKDLNAAAQNYSKNRFNSFVGGIQSAESWQSPEKMNEIISLVENEKNSNIFGMGESDYDDILSFLNERRDLYSKYASAEEYVKTPVNEQTDYEKVLGEYMSRPDYLTVLSQFKKGIETFGDEFHENRLSKTPDGDAGAWDENYMLVNRYATKGAEQTLGKLQDMTDEELRAKFGGGWEETYRLVIDMFQEERDVYNYIRETEGPTAANAFLDNYVRPRILQNMTVEAYEKDKKLAEEHPVAAYILAFGNKLLLEPVQGATNMIVQLADPEAYRKNALALERNIMQTGTIRQTQTDNLDGAWKHVYTIGTGVADLAGQVAMSKGLATYASALGAVDKVSKLKKTIDLSNKGKNAAYYYIDQAAKNRIAGWAMMSMNASTVMGETLSDARRRGLSDTQMSIEALGMAAIEALTENIGLDELMRADGSIIRSALSEGFEEGLSAFGGTVLDAVVAGDKSNWQSTIKKYTDSGKSKKDAVVLALRDTAGDILYEAAVGALVGGTFKGSQALIGKISSGSSNVVKSPINVKPKTEVTKSNASKLISKWGGVSMTKEDVGLVNINPSDLLPAVNAARTGQEAAAIASVRRVVQKGTVVPTDTPQGILLRAAMSAMPGDVVLTSVVKMHDKSKAVHGVAVRLSPSSYGEYDVSGILLDGDVMMDLTQAGKIPLAQQGETGYTGNNEGTSEGVDVGGNRNPAVLGDGHGAAGKGAGKNGVRQSDYDTQEVSGRMGNGSSNAEVLRRARSRSDGEFSRNGYFSTERLRYDDGLLGALSEKSLSGRDIYGRSISVDVSETFDKTVFKNENGDLVSVFHWTEQQFSSFEYGEFGFHFGSLRAAENRGNGSGILKECYLNVRNPVVVDHPDPCTWSPFALAHILNRLGVVSNTDLENVLSYEGAHSRTYDAPAAEALRALLKTKGYDGILYRNDFEGDTSVIAFDASQIYIVADHENVMGKDGSLPSTDGTGSNSYTQNEESPQQSAVGSVSRTQNSDVARDFGVEIGVRPAEMDTVFKKMSAKQKKKLYADLESHTGVKIVEDTTLAVDGEYDHTTKTIRINPNRATPLTVIKHELTHYLESSGILYQDFMNYAFEKSETFKQWVNSKVKGPKSLTEKIDILRKKVAERYAAEGIALDTESGASADQEILANFAAEVLFTDINALRELGQKNRTLFQRLKHFVMGIINKFRGVTTDPEIERMEQMFAAAVEGVQDTPVEVGKKFSIQRDSDGNEIVVVDTDQGIFAGAAPSEYSRIVRQYFNERFKGVTLPIGNNGDVISMSKKLPGEYAYPHTSLPGQSPEYRVKMKAITELDNLLLTARNHYYSRDTKGNPEATFGWDYYDVEFLCDGMQVSALINIANSEKGRAFYDITKIKVAPAISEKYVTLLAHSPFTSQGTTDTFRITENHPSVNIYSTQNGTKKFIATDDSSTEDVDSRPISQWSEEEMMAEIARRKPKQSPNPLQTAQLKPKDAITTPELRQNGKMNVTGDGESAFASSVQGSDIFSDELKALSSYDENITRYDTITNLETMEEANNKINEGGRAFVEEFARRDSSTYTAEDMAVALILISRYEAIGDHRNALTLMGKLREAGTKHGQAVQILSLLGRLTPDGMVMYAQKELAEAYKILVEGKTQKWIDDNQWRFSFTDEEIDFIRRRTWQAAQLPKGRDKDIRLAEIASLIQSKIPQEKGQAYKAWQRTAMLLNPKTQLRNVLGNLTMVPAFLGSDFIGGGIDRLIAKKTGVRTTTSLLSKGSVKGIKQGLFESYDDFIRHINTRDIKADRFEIDHRSLDNFNEHHTGRMAGARNKLSRALNALDRFNSFLLDAGDRPFYEMWFINSLNGQMAANNVSEPTADMIEIATLDALQRTWQDTNKMTEAASNIKRVMNYVSVGGYGLGDVVIKFTKTPANLTKAMFDFSPAGLMKALSIDAARFSKAVKEGRATPQMQRAFVKNLSNGIVGSLLTAIGAGLAMAGLITGDKDEDEDVSAFERAVLGYQPYSFKIGNMSFTYDWMQPTGALFAIMADYYQDKRNAELTGQEKEWYETFWDAINTGGTVLFNQSFMQSIQTIFADDNVIYNLANAVLNDSNAPVPQMLSQLASTLDPTVRQSYESGNPVQTSINKVLYKIPGLRETLAPSVDVLGNEREQLDSGIGRAFKSFISPANVGVGYDSKAGEEMYRLYEATGDPAAIAPTAPSTISAKGGTYRLSAHQKADYQKITGKIASEAVEGLEGESLYRALSDEEKVDLLSSVYSYAGQVARSQVLDIEMTESAAKAKKAIDGGIPVEMYFLIKMSASTDGNDSISQKEARAILDSTDLSKDQKAIMWKSFNSKWKNNPYGTYKLY